jgi:hypothetical protein
MPGLNDIKKLRCQTSPRARVETVQPRCGGKIKDPTSNPREAFCCKGCFTSYYRNRCIVCERSYNRTREDQHTCGRRKCKGELRRHRLRYRGKWVQIPDEALSTIRNPIKSGFKTGITSLRGWRWIRLPGEDDDWQLLNREGKQVARIRQEGELYWVSHPSRLPEPPLEGLGPANMRAELLALWTLEPWSVRAPRLSAKQRALLTAIIRRDHAPINLLGGYCFESTPALDQELVKTIRQMESCLGEPLPTASSPPFVPTWTPSARRTLAN